MRSRQAGRDDKSLPHPTIELQGNEEKHMSTTRPSSVMSRRTLAACALMPLHLLFLWLPGYFLAIAAYIVLNLGERKAQ